MCVIYDVLDFLEHRHGREVGYRLTEVRIGKKFLDLRIIEPRRLSGRSKQQPRGGASLHDINLVR